jgi:hypothetical protein
VVCDQTETLLNASAQHAVFPTFPTPIDKVRNLIQRLHPVSWGGDLIRFGPTGDGGYLIPNDLEGIAACFSPGVSDVAGFELACAERGMKVFMADGSVDRLPAVHRQFVFVRKFIGSTTDGEFISFSEWVASSLPESTADLLLQMDIEGSEYETFVSIPDHLLTRFRIIVVEFHHLDYLFSAPLFALYSRAFEKILRTHTCVHIHPNNVCHTIKVHGLEIPQMAEFTFLRSDRISKPVFAQRFPHPLDHDNTDNPSVPLPESCYRADPPGPRERVDGGDAIY